MDASLKEAVEALRDFRAFTISNAVKWRMGASHHNPMWERVAVVLDKHGMNNEDGGTFRCAD